MFITVLDRFYSIFHLMTVMSSKNIDEEPDFSDAEGYFDNISDEELLQDIIEQKPNEAVGVENVIIVDNLPVVPPEKKAKLYNAIAKLFDKAGPVKSNFFPDDANGQTKGYIFLEFDTKEIAQAALVLVNGYRLDKQHTLVANMFTDVEKFQNVDENFVKPEPQPYRNHGNLYSWLQQPDAYDQLVTVSKSDEMVTVFQSARKNLVKVIDKKRWTETDYIVWSPSGKYLGTVHQKGVALWGSEDFHQVARFAHNNCKSLEFSTCERFIITFRRPTSAAEEPQSVIIWEIRDQSNRRQFKSDGYLDCSGFKWSYNGSFLARCLPDASKIAVYESKTFTLLDKRPIDVPHVREIEWNPAHDQLACWCAEAGQTPARILIFGIPSRQELRSVNAFTAIGCQLFWHPEGTYMAARVEKYSKVKKDGGQTKYTGLSQNLHIFWAKAREKDIPVELVELKGPLQALSWEPSGGNRFAVSIGETDTEVVVYRVAATKVEIQVTLPMTQVRVRCNGLYWSPAGGVFVITAKDGSMEFYDANESVVMSSDAKQNKPAFYEWDPTGRYFMSGSLVHKNTIENGLIIWSATGRKISELKKDGLSFAKWRPRPSSLLSPEALTDVKKNLKKYSKRFDEEDRKKLSKATKEQLEVRRAKMDEYVKWRKCLVDQREQLLSEVDDEDVRNIAELLTADREKLAKNGYVEEIREVLENVDEELTQ